MHYRKHYIALESNPDVFTQLVRELGLSSALAFCDILSIQDDELLDMVLRPVLALILVFPTSLSYEQHVAEEDRETTEYRGCGDEEEVMWYKQTINNACGLYAILHAVSNGAARDFVVPGSHLDRLIQRCASLRPADRAKALEDDEELEEAYKMAARLGDSEAPAHPEDEVDFHYVCFVKSHKNGHLYELDGDRKGPRDWGRLREADDVLVPASLAAVRTFIQRIGLDMGFSLLALAPV